MHYLIYQPGSASQPLLPPAALDAEEQQTYARRGLPYLQERTLLRRELARLSGIPAEDIRFTYSEHGKPEFAPQPFNLSHSGQLLCLAFHHSAVGVDIEHMRPRTGLARPAKRIMCARQLAAWQERGCPLQEFYTCWCTAEAVIKLYGSSIWQAQQYPFLYHPGDKPHIELLWSGAPTVQIFTPAEGYAGAVAYHS